MKRSELKQLIRETIEEQIVQEGLPMGSSKLAQEAAVTLNNIVGRIQRPDLAKKARVHAAEIINLIDQDKV